MSNEVRNEIDLGEGVYTFSEAARIITRKQKRITSRQVRYWMNTGLAPASHRVDDSFAVLSFTDLLSLEIVRRFRLLGLSLQAVRRLEAKMRVDHPDLARPFAHDLFFTDGVSVWRSLHPGDRTAVEEILGPRRGHLAWTEIIRSFADELDFEGPDGQASSWTLTEWVEINPSVQFGAPVVRGTRTPVRTVLANLEIGTPRQVADWYGLSVRQVEGVRDSLAA